MSDLVAAVLGVLVGFGLGGLHRLFRVLELRTVTDAMKALLEIQKKKP